MKRLALVPLSLAMAFAMCAISFADTSPPARTVTGTLEDSFCYAAMGAKGSSHQSCAISCVKKGIPAILVEQKTNQTYVLLPPKNDQPLPSSVIDNMEKQVTVTGKEYDNGGTRFLTVESLK